LKLPNVENAFVDVSKLRDYCLNPNHPEGKHKARAFQEKLGIGRNDAELLRKIILEGIIKADATEQKPVLYGRRFRVDFEVERGQQFVLLKAVV
jgi:hypothetical protein